MSLDLVTYPHGIQRAACKIKRRHQGHPVQTHPPHLCLPAKLCYPMNDGNDKRKAQPRVHDCTVWPISWTAESWMQGGIDASCCQHRDKSVARLLKGWCAVETVVDTRYGGAPHENNDAQLGAVSPLSWA
jgi:hypothetical protein